MAGKHTILFVDDEENILSSLHRLFRREGYQILLAQSGLEGLELLKEHEVSLIVSDQRMPEMIGAEFLARARKIAPDSVRMLLTGYADIEATTQAINEGGIARYITKPWNDENLKMIIRDALERVELEQQNRELTRQLQQQNDELEDFNTRLEETVHQRTTQLRFKVVELEGKDRLAQHMLSVHSLEETLDLILQTITEIIEMDKAVIYLGTQARPAAAIGAFASGILVAQDDLQRLEVTSIHEQAFARVAARRTPVNIKDPKGHPIPPFAVVPILCGEEFLGFIEVANPQNPHPVSDSELQVVASFALQAAMAISDAQAHGDIGSWKSELAEVLKDVGDLGNLGS